MAVDPMLGQIRTEETIHDGYTRNVPGENPVDHPMPTIAAQAEVENSTIKNTDIEHYAVFLHEMSESHIKGMYEIFIRSMTDVTHATGNVVDAGGPLITGDKILDTLETVEMTFDSDGKPQPLHMWSPDPQLRKQLFNLMKTGPTKEQQKRMDEIIERKKNEFLAKKRTRRLS